MADVKSTVIEVDIKGNYQAGHSPQIKHKLEHEATSPTKTISKEEIAESLRNAGDNRAKILDIKKEKAGQESERVSENLQKQEQKRSELDKKIKDEIQHAETLREQHLDSIRAKASADVAHAKEVAAKVKSDKSNS